jgi:hypothetical protein
MLCPRCGSQILAEDANLDTLVARCRQCQEVFNFADQVGARPAAKPVYRAPRPGGVAMEDLVDRRRLSWAWFRWPVLFMVLFCVVWDSFLVFWYSIALGGNAPWIMSVFPLLHVAVGVGITYLTLAMLFNRTRVEVGTDGLSVRHGPVPWAGNVTLDPGEIRQLYCDQTQNRNRRGYPNTTFNVNAVLTDDRRVKLLGGLDDRGLALFVEQQVEEWLGLPNEHVPGELR